MRSHRFAVARLIVILAAAAVVVAIAIDAHAAPAVRRPDIAITDVSIVDVEHARMITPRTVVVSEGRIVAIDTPAKAHVPRGAQRIDGHGRFLIPGLVDMHVHLFNNASKRPPNTWSFPLYVANGVTAVREMAALPESIATVNAWRASVTEGTLVAPRIVAAGVVVDGASPVEAAQRVDVAADAGADFIKVFSDVSAANWRAILDESRRRALPLAGHVPAGVPVLTAATAGQRTDEHLTQVFEACTPIEQRIIDERRDLAGDALVELSDAQEPLVLDSYERRACERVARALAPTGLVQVPTLVLAWVESKPPDPAMASDPRWKYLRADERARWQRVATELTPDQRAVAARRWGVARKITATLHDAGVTMIAGTDAPMPGVYPGSALHDELERFVDAGFTPAEALRAATLGPASFLGIADKAGSVDVGKRADLVLLDADPLRDIRNTRRIEAVVLDGRPLTRAALDALLAAAANAAGSN